MAAKGAYTFGKARQERGACPKRSELVRQLQAFGYRVERHVIYKGDVVAQRRAKLGDLKWLVAKLLMRQRLTEIGYPKHLAISSGVR